MTAVPGDGAPRPDVLVRLLAADEHDAVTELVGAAFAADPLFVALLPDADDRLRGTTALYRTVVDDEARVVDVAVAGPVSADGGTTEEPLGAALWSWSPGREQHRGLATFVRHASEALATVRDLGARAAQQLGRHDALVERHRPTTPHWYLEAVAVSEAARGRGVGSALLTTRLAALDARGEVAFLEATTPASRRLYERHGFALAAEVPSPLGVTTYAMLRPARG